MKGPSACFPFHEFILEFVSLNHSLTEQLPDQRYSGLPLVPNLPRLLKSKILSARAAESHRTFQKKGGQHSVGSYPRFLIGQQAHRLGLVRSSVA